MQEPGADSRSGLSNVSKSDSIPHRATTTNQRPPLKCPCNHCQQDIEFPDDLLGQQIACPICGAQTALYDPYEVVIPTIETERVAATDAATNLVGEISTRLIGNMERVVLGKRDKIVLTLVAFFSEGHVLLEDVPGVAKTMLARALAQSVGGSFKRVQCTPDLLPNDITGASIFNPKTTEFEFRKGPLFAQIVLADEINRATPRAQAALLEAMAERQVSVDGTIHKLQKPFFIIATQNPVDHEGTFPHPEAQLDRFLVRLSLGYPSEEEENLMIERLQLSHPIEELDAVISPEEVLQCQKAVRAVQVHERVRNYMVQVIRASREHDAIILGGSPRASLALFRASQAYASINGFDYVLPDDVKHIAPAVLAHRVILRPESRLRKVTADSVVAEILREVPVPTLPDTIGQA